MGRCGVKTVEVKLKIKSLEWLWGEGSGDIWRKSMKYSNFLGAGRVDWRNVAQLLDSNIMQACVT